ncbi:hypothetical protein [Aeoliella mucimassa]|uniref:Uncharacterized protein n=1 Tax=Aeoliella mucimassa TaxID=2527972 RepID=A0A518AVL2_9BACT|nr:hypothetical protein [Aeoliella mucimassa]QDU58775.1 hypothetical protein Pan181_50150 [Aeoliella mucimassa]
MNRPRFTDRLTRAPSKDGLVLSTPNGLEIGGAALEQLEELDDAIFAALDGDATALDRLSDLWHTVHREVDTPFVAESRAEYTRQARRVLDSALKLPENSLGRGFAALEVLGLVGQPQV